MTSGIVRVTGKGRRWLSGGHPWVFRDDVQSADAEPGSIVRVEDPRGAPLGSALFSAASKIALRMLESGDAAIDEGFWHERVARALALRTRAGLDDPRGACRVIAGDADGVPGLVVDRYADVLVAQCGTLAADRLRNGIFKHLRALGPWPIACCYDRSDASVRRLEGLEARVEVVDGELSAEVLVRERDLEFTVDVAHGHKTGHYLDQRENRAHAARHASGEDVLDAFSYDGLFGVRAALAGAKSVTCVDQSQAALERARANAERNRVAERMRFDKADCMDDLRARSERGERFGVVIVDPPAFAKNRAALAGAERGYVELNRRAFELVRDGGVLVSASCSYNVRAAQFVEFLARASHVAGVRGVLEELRGAGADHPVLLTLPETAYLKCAFVRVERTAS